MDDGQYLLGVLLTFCTLFYYYANEAVSSNCIHKDLRTQQFWMVTPLYWSLILSYYLGEETSQLLIKCLSVWQIIRVCVELISPWKKRIDDPIL